MATGIEDGREGADLSVPLNGSVAGRTGGLGHRLEWRIAGEEGKGLRHGSPGVEWGEGDQGLTEASIAYRLDIQILIFAFQVCKPDYQL